EGAEQYRLVLKSASPPASLRGYLGTNLAARAEFERKAGRLVDAATVLSERRELLAEQPQELYATAREYAWLALRAGQGKAKPSSEEAAGKSRYSALAVETLKDAFAKGFKDVDQARRDTALAILRGRADFNALLKK